jgi:drug/metabolite transporter (DMT)-like permease
MIHSEMLAVIYGLGSGLSWGAGDFSGGYAARKCSVYTVLLFSQIIGATLLISIAILFAKSVPTVSDLMYGVFAGFSGAFGLIALYKALSLGRMGIVAPISAVLAAIIPILFTFISEGLPPLIKISGFGIALFAVWLLSYSHTDNDFRKRESYLPFLAGLGFGLYFIFMDRAIHSAVLWPMVSSRLMSLGVFTIIYLIKSTAKTPGRKELLPIALAGIFDIGGNALFALATHLGRLDISATLASLYPAATVLLALLILKERLIRPQWIGVAAACLALVMIC